MDKVIHHLFLLSFIVCVIAKVEWKVEEKIIRYGEDLRLLCIADNYTFDGVEIKRWEGGPKQKMLTFNGAPDQDDVMKYNMSMRQDGFDLLIKNVTEIDLNVTYKCTFGFKSSGKVMLISDDAFEVPVRQTMKPSKIERKGDNTSIIYVILLSVLPVLVVAVIVILFTLQRKGKLKDLKDKLCDNKAKAEHRGTSVAWKAEEDASLLPQPNEGNLENIEDVPFVSIQPSQPEIITETNIVEPSNTELVDEFSNDASLKSVTVPKDPASCTFTEVNECNSFPQLQIGGQEECQDVPVVPMTPHQLELPVVASVTESKTLEPCITDPNGESVDETSLKHANAVGDPASSLTASVPDRGFQYSILDEQENKKHTPAHNKYNAAYKCPNTREKSFKSQHCKWTLSQPSIQQMAKAGFFCSGHKSKVQCYSCGKRSDWQEGDDPFDEIFHENCRHLKHIKGKQASGEGL
ncbi:uncharacterized protein LOC127702204 [Mytilus californianus]|uniref:uncharacterized protein LOC127702204 n=1 Tax=Mytilus californianus TaxID=6549 RepID=UPI0022476FEB|nr:uncharacterized protein LOC127702204 [Mytilus californianus]